MRIKGHNDRLLGIIGHHLKYLACELLGLGIVPLVSRLKGFYLFREGTIRSGNGFGLGRSDPSPEGKLRATAKLREVLQENAKLGYGDYRAPPMLQDDVADQYSYNDFALRRFTETLKDAIDPNGILSPGRAGVWPARHRSLRGSLRS